MGLLSGSGRGRQLRGQRPLAFFPSALPGIPPAVLRSPSSQPGDGELTPWVASDPRSTGPRTSAAS